MAGISDLIQTMGAIVIFSLILLSANRMILSNTQSEIQTEAERIAIGLAQSVINEAQSKSFDDFDDYDDYDDIKKDTGLGENSFEVNVEVSYVSPAFLDCDSNGTKPKCKKMVVTVRSDYLKNAVKLSYLRRYYKTTN